MFTVYITMSNGHLNTFEGQDFTQLEELKLKYQGLALEIEIVNSSDLSEISLGLSMGYR